MGCMIFEAIAMKGPVTSYVIYQSLYCTSHDDMIGRVLQRPRKIFPKLEGAYSIKISRLSLLGGEHVHAC